ncbi:hypothetical protein AB0E59_01880 [Lentzea sp. NPDC034063]|uniref:hypothetical protein n=1 Tax=unclassified Lentzea TaxID=2643253 RepID=UPI0033CDC088
MTANPAEVSLTSPRSATAQRLVSGLALVAVVAGGVAVAFSGEPWWAIVLWEFALLVTAVICAAIWASAGESAKETAALRAKGITVVAEVLDSTAHDDGESVSHALTLWIPASGGGFEVRHHCDHYDGEQHLQVLVDPAVRTWGVVH